MILPRLRSRWTACGEPSPRTACTVGVASEPATKSRDDSTATLVVDRRRCHSLKLADRRRLCAQQRTDYFGKCGVATGACFNLADKGGNGHWHGLILPLFL